MKNRKNKSRMQIPPKKTTVRLRSPILYIQKNKPLRLPERKKPGSLSNVSGSLSAVEGSAIKQEKQQNASTPLSSPAHPPLLKHPRIASQFLWRKLCDCRHLFNHLLSPRLPERSRRARHQTKKQQNASTSLSSPAHPLLLKIQELHRNSCGES